MKPVHVKVVKNTKNVVVNSMKVWISDTKAPSHRIVKLHCEEHSNFTYAGDFTDKELEHFLLELDPNIDLEKNIKLIKYYGYLHLFIISKKEN